MFVMKIIPMEAVHAIHKAWGFFRRKKKKIRKEKQRKNSS